MFAPRRSGAPSVVPWKQPSVEPWKQPSVEQAPGETPVRPLTGETPVRPLTGETPVRPYSSPGETLLRTGAPSEVQAPGETLVRPKTSPTGAPSVPNGWRRSEMGAPSGVTTEAPNVWASVATAANRRSSF